MKYAEIDFGNGALLSTNLDWNGRFFICHSKGVSVIRRQRIDVRKFFGFPLKTSSRERFDAWMDEIEAADQLREEKKVAKKIDHSTGFGPECHLDESDPNYQTRTVI